jgi:protein-S-isoprenylcysteine O-methyltransferase Ste14
LITGKILILKRKGVTVNSNSKKSAFVKYFLYPIFLLVITLFISELVRPALKIEQLVLPEFISQNLFNSISLKIFGSLLIATSIIFLFFTLRSFNKSMRFGMDSKNLGKLITTGVFSISRNPFFISIIFYFAGIALICPSPFFIGFATLTIISIHLFILKEEIFLKINYGEEYNNYTENVRRYF